MSKGHEINLDTTMEPPLKHPRLEPTERAAALDLPFPFSDLISCTTLSETLRPEVGATPRAHSLLAWFIAVAESQANPAPQTAKWYLPLQGWEIAEAEALEVRAVRKGPIVCHPNDVVTITGLVVKGYSTRLKAGNERLFLPRYAVAGEQVLLSHTVFKLEPFKGKDLNWLGVLFEWLCKLSLTNLIPALPSIATSVIRVASRGTAAFVSQIEGILAHSDPAVVLTSLTQAIEEYGPSEAVFAPFLVCLRTPLLEGLPTTGKWDIIRDSRFRGMSTAILVELITSLKILPPTPPAVMKQYFDEQGKPFPVKALRDCTEADFVPCGPKATTGQNLVALLNDEDAQVSAMPSATSVVYVKARGTNVLSRKGTLDTLGLEVVRGDLLSSAANPRPPVAVSSTPGPSVAIPKVSVTFEY